MPSILEQGTEEGLGLLGQQSRGLDLTAPTPDLEIPELPEDRTVLGIQVVPAAKRAEIKLERERQNLDKLIKSFEISDKIIKTSHTKEGAAKQQYLKRISPSITRAFGPELMKTIRTFADDPSGYKDVVKNISDPQVRSIVQSFGKVGDFNSAMKAAIGAGKKKPTEPQVVSPTKQEREQVSRFIERNWPEDIPDLGDQQEDFIDILGSKAKEVARKKKINLDDALNQAWPQVYQDNIAEGEKTGWFDLKIDTPTSVKARQEAQRIVEEYTKDNPAAPTSQDEFKKLPPGSWFINPSNNKLLRKSSGK